MAILRLATPPPLLASLYLLNVPFLIADDLALRILTDTNHLILFFIKSIGMGWTANVA